MPKPLMWIQILNISPLSVPPGRISFQLSYNEQLEYSIHETFFHNVPIFYPENGGTNSHQASAVIW